MNIQNILIPECFKKLHIEAAKNHPEYIIDINEYIVNYIKEEKTKYVQFSTGGKDGNGKFTIDDCEGSKKHRLSLHGTVGYHNFGFFPGLIFSTKNSAFNSPCQAVLNVEAKTLTKII